MTEYTFTNAKYITNDVGENTVVEVAINGGNTSHVPVCAENTHYAEIMRQVEAGELTIADAD